MVETSVSVVSADFLEQGFQMIAPHLRAIINARHVPRRKTDANQVD